MLQTPVGIVHDYNYWILCFVLVHVKILIHYNLG